MKHPDPDPGAGFDKENDTDATLASLLKAAGPRAEPPPDFARELKATLHAEWQASLEESREQHALDAKSRARERWRLGGAAVAAVAVAAIGLGLWLSQPAAVVVAQVMQQTGSVQLPEVLAAGERIVTGQGRVALAFASGVSVRLDSHSSLTLDGAGLATLTGGAVYVDGGTRGDRALTIATPFGDVRHVGTQYEARLLPDGLQVAVREGLVEVQRPEATLQGAAGERLRVTAAGDVERTQLAPDAPDWAWASAIAPTFDIEQQPLTGFLAWAGRETGRSVVFSSSASQAAAAAIVLKGSVAGLTPDQALDAVIATTTLGIERSPGQILIRD